MLGLRTLRSSLTGLKQSLRNYSTNLSRNSNKASVYVHWPYCAKICPYCDFNKYTNHQKVDHNRMKLSLLKELEYFLHLKTQNNPNLQISSLYFGKNTQIFAPFNFAKEAELLLLPRYNILCAFLTYID